MTRTSRVLQDENNRLIRALSIRRFIKTNRRSVSPEGRSFESSVFVAAKCAASSFVFSGKQLTQRSRPGYNIISLSTLFISLVSLFDLQHLTLTTMAYDTVIDYTVIGPIKFH